MKPTEQEILNALSNIIDPDFHKDIVSLGFIKNLKNDSGNVTFDIQLTTPACPVRHEFQNNAQELVSKLPGVKTVTANLTAPAGSAAPGPQTPLTSHLSRVKSIIAISSCKGGVGKSTVAAYIAQELAHRGFKVGLVDTDIYGPSIPTLFNLSNAAIYINDKNELIPVEKNKLKIMSFGFLLGDSAAVMRGPMVSRYVQQMMHTTNWGELDYLFVDMPPGTGDIQLTITQTVRLSGAVIVTTPQTLSLVDVARGILMFEKVNVPILGLVENMAYFLCDQCHKKHFIFGADKINLNERFGIETLAQLPILPQLIGKIETPIVNDYISEMVDNVVRAIGKMSIAKRDVPEIKFDDKNVCLKWQDGTSYKISNRDLRLSCRCALCINEMTGEKILKESSIRKDIAPTQIFPLGNYALAINWNDGHNSGIYPYANIKEIANAA
ncbi:MAG: hypothetical protein A2Z88_10715 [Omnitrophica WOR_2 bacterium GWA2_47_8]|nr:MAG: hypothetical protein A2Z88_10715 [Omnitrophica WOR_2 bacterium GWA2_47_8]